MSATNERSRGESHVERIVFSVILLLKMLMPPMLSLKRMENTCRKLIAKHPKAYTPQECLADMYRMYDKNEEARQEYEKLWELWPLYDVDKLNFAEVLFKLKDFNRVIEVSEPVISSFPKNVNANWRLAMSLMETQRYDKAVIYFKKSISTGPKRYKDYWRLGFCLSALGQLREALQAYQAGLALKPDSKELRENIARTQYRLEQASTNPDAGNSCESDGTPPNLLPD